jgi:hypothetical protein
MPQSLGRWNRLIGELPMAIQPVYPGLVKSMVKSMVKSLIFCGVTYHLWWGKKVYIYRKRSSRTLKNSNLKSKNHELRHGDQ